MGDHNLKQKMLSGALWQSLERFGLQGFSFVLQLVLARLLLPDDFGIVVLLDIFIQLAWCFVDSGFGVSMIQCREAEEKDFSGIYWISQGIAFLLYAMLCGIVLFSQETKSNVVSSPPNMALTTPPSQGA